MTMNHMLGYNLGLTAVFHPNCAYSTPVNMPDLSNPSAATNNVMDHGYGTFEAYANCQVARMHHTLSQFGWGNTWEALDIDFCVNDQNENITINGTHEWKSARNLKGDLLLEPASELTMFCRLGFSGENSKIILGDPLLIDKRPATLIFDGGYVGKGAIKTEVCDGIFQLDIEGNGTVIIRNFGKIEATDVFTITVREGVTVEVEEDGLLAVYNGGNLTIENGTVIVRSEGTLWTQDNGTFILDEANLHLLRGCFACIADRNDFSRNANSETDINYTAGTNPSLNITTASCDNICNPIVRYDADFNDPNDSPDAGLLGEISVAHEPLFDNGNRVNTLPQQTIWLGQSVGAFLEWDVTEEEWHVTTDVATATFNIFEYYDVGDYIFVEEGGDFPSGMYRIAQLLGTEIQTAVLQPFSNLDPAMESDFSSVSGQNEVMIRMGWARQETALYTHRWVNPDHRPREYAAWNGCGVSAAHQMHYEMEMDRASSERATLPFYNALNFGTGDFTVEAKIRAVNQDGYFMIVSNRSNYGAGFFLALNTNSGQGIHTGVLYGQINGANFNPWGLTNLKDGQCHHVAMVREGTNLTFYLDGVQYGGTLAIGTRNMNSGGEWWIGRDRADNNHNFNGGISMLRVWNVARTAAQIAANQNALLPANTANLVAYLRCNDEADNTLVLDGALPAAAQDLRNRSTQAGALHGFMGDDPNNTDVDPAWSAPICTPFATPDVIPNARIAYVIDDFVPDSLKNNISLGRVQVAPNPFKEQINLQLPYSDDAPVQVALYDMTGRAVLQTQILANGTQQQIDVPTALPSGMYILRLQYGQENKTIKLVRE